MNAAITPPLTGFVDIVGERYALSDPGDMAAYVEEPRGLFRQGAALVLRPGTVDQVAAIVRLANTTGTALVPQGGNTGLVGGQVPRQGGMDIIVSLTRLAQVREINATGDYLIAEAGMTLAAVQDAAGAVDRMFPLTLASEGSCQIGGNLSTNAGGTAVLAYGTTRDLVLGIEVVLATGEVWDGLRTLRKDNTGYDLKQLFIGAEGSLGIITAAALKLFPRPLAKAVVFCGVPSPAAALRLLTIARETSASDLTAFELMPRLALELVLRHVPGTRDPLAGRHDWYILFEVSSGRSAEAANDAAEVIFARGMEVGLAADGVRAENLDQAAQLWRIRHDLSVVQRREGASIKHDVAVPVEAVPELVERGAAAVADLIPGCRPLPFGHLGDGNIHFNIGQPVGADKQTFLDRWDEVNAVVHGIVAELGGTIAAEHGIGQLKRDLLVNFRSETELAMMRRLKAAFDPNGILNPGKVL